MSNFAELKRKSQSNFDFLQKELQKSTNANSSGDERLWSPHLTLLATVTQSSVSCQLPRTSLSPGQRLYNHAFQGPGGWLIDNCPTTKGEQCPVCAANNKLWNSGVESDKEVARQRKRKLSYYSNIYVVRDSANPENEGKVFLYKYGKKIHDKILAAMQPEFDDETPVNPFDLWEGANFKLKIRTVAGYWNYDASEFAAPTALSADDDEMEQLWKQAHSLEAFTAADQFKSYDEIESAWVLCSAPLALSNRHSKRKMRIRSLPLVGSTLLTSPRLHLVSLPMRPTTTMPSPTFRNSLKNEVEL